MTDPRAFLRQHVKEHGLTLDALSLAIGRNPTYLQQYLTKGSPKVLPEDVRLRLAMELRVDERLLGAREPWTPDGR